MKVKFQVAESEPVHVEKDYELEFYTA